MRHDPRLNAPREPSLIEAPTARTSLEELSRGLAWPHSRRSDGSFHGWGPKLG